MSSQEKRATTQSEKRRSTVRATQPVDDASDERVLALLDRMLDAKQKGETYLPNESEELAYRRALSEDYVIRRGGRHVISDYGIQYLETETGEPSYLTQVRARSDDRFKIKKFQVRAQQKWHESFQIEDVVRLLASALDADQFAVLRGIGVEAGLNRDPNQAAITALALIIENLSVRRLPPSPERDRVLARLLSDTEDQK